jgi:hypothetical protein
MINESGLKGIELNIIISHNERKPDNRAVIRRAEDQGACRGVPEDRREHVVSHKRPQVPAAQEARLNECREYRA